MSNTRYSTNSDPSHAPERNLSSAANRTVNVSLAIAAAAARNYASRDREAVLWLANLAANSRRIQVCWQRRGLPDPLGTVGRITEAALCSRLGLDPIDVYRALTGHDEADLPRFTAAIERFRAEFEAALPPLVKTRDTRTIQAAFIAAGDEHNIVTIEGKWRHGKTEESERWWLKNLHRCVWLRCPSDNTERTFIDSFAAALGISTGSGKKPHQLRTQIKNALGPGLIDTVIINEAHYLFPADLVNAKPARAEYVRELRDELGVGFALIVTDQFALAMELSKVHNKRYAPGQLAGRRDQFRLHDTHTDAEIRAIARLHAGQIEEAALDGLTAFARAEEGYLGIMVIAARRARREAAERGPGSQVTAADVAIATKAEAVSDRVTQLLAEARPKRRGRFAILEGRAA